MAHVPARGKRSRRHLDAEQPKLYPLVCCVVLQQRCWVWLKIDFFSIVIARAATKAFVENLIHPLLDTAKIQLVSVQCKYKGAESAFFHTHGMPLRILHTAPTIFRLFHSIRIRVSYKHSDFSSTYGILVCGDDIFFSEVATNVLQRPECAAIALALVPCGRLNALANHLHGDFSAEPYVYV